MNNFLGQGQGPSNQGIGQGIGDKISSGLSSISSGINSGISQSTTGFDSFYIMVVAIAVIVLILVLAFLGWTMSKQKATDTFPKLQTSCPDFWGIETDSATGKTYCKQPASNQVNYGSAKASEDAQGFADGKFDFANAGWSAGGNAVCSKKKWANSHGINWDTVTNANYC